MTLHLHTTGLILDKFNYTLLCSPGQFKYIKTTISGITESDVAILVIPADIEGYDESMTKGNEYEEETEGMSRVHSKLASCYGITKLIVVINKMDHDEIKWSESRYNKITTEIKQMLKKLGYKTNKIPFIPISAYFGDNVVTKSKNMEWYKGFNVEIKQNKIHGYTLLDALNKVITKPKAYNDRPFRMAIAWRYSNYIVTGKIIQGTIREGQTVNIYPSKTKACIDTMEINRKRVNIAYAGSNIGIKLVITHPSES